MDTRGGLPRTGLVARNRKWRHRLTAMFVSQELTDLSRDPPAQCSAGPVGEDSKKILLLHMTARVCVCV